MMSKRVEFARFVDVFDPQWDFAPLCGGEETGEDGVVGCCCGEEEGF